MSDAEQIAKFIHEYMTTDMHIVLVDEVHQDTNISVINREKFADDLAKVLVKRYQPIHPVYKCSLCSNQQFESCNGLINHIFDFHSQVKPVDGELRESIARIAHKIMYPNQYVRKSFSTIADMHKVVDDAKDELLQLFTAHLQAAVNNAEVQMFHRVGDVLSWHIAQGNIEMKHRNLEQIMQQLNQGEK